MGYEGFDCKVVTSEGRAHWVMRDIYLDSTYPPPCHNTHTRRDYIIIQRPAVAKPFMRTSSTERGVGLLLFDEPSTSLDPTAKHNAISPPSASVSFVLL